jgi:hypothetical protein
MGMSITKVIGLILMVIGVALIIVGVSSSRSLADNISTLFTGRLTQHTLWYIIGGAVSAVIGLLLTIGVLGRSRWATAHDLPAGRGRVGGSFSGRYHGRERGENMFQPIGILWGIVTLVFGILVLVYPKFLRYLIGIYLVVAGAWAIIARLRF